VSQSSSISLNCPSCDHAQAFTTWNSVNVGLSPEKKTELRNGTLTRFTCEQCGESSEVNYPMLYHDPKLQFMVWLNPDRNAPAFSGLELGDVLADYRLRLVESRNQLVEKTHIFENELDDVTMELFKASMAAAPKGIPEGELLFAGWGEGQGEVVELQFAVVAETGTKFIGTTRDAFEETAEILAPFAAQARLELGQWHRVDRAWAGTLLADHI
jgi:hypothetical protein